jgi:hypothetical protein
MGFYVKFQCTKNGKTRELTAYHGGTRAERLEDSKIEVLRKQLQASHPGATIGAIRAFDPEKDGQPPELGVMVATDAPSTPEVPAAPATTSSITTPPAAAKPLPPVVPLPKA